jgi:hypothetical protein
MCTVGRDENDELREYQLCAEQPLLLGGSEIEW